MIETMPSAADVARRLSEDARALNYATLPAGRFPGLEWPSDAYETLGALAEAARRLTQATGQVAAFLRSQADRPGVYDDGGRSPHQVIGMAEGDLARAVARFEATAAALDGAQQAVSGLGVRDTGGCGAR